MDVESFAPEGNPQDGVTNSMPQLAAESLPTRNELRALLAPARQRVPAAIPVLLLAFDAAVWLGALVAVAAPTPLWAKLCGSVVLWLWSARLFVIGHDACHGSYTQWPLLNACLGRIAFLPTLTPYSLWAVGHNLVHHRYNNLKGYDYVWEPFAPEEYTAAPRWRRALERVYRSGYAPGVYYLIELWWNKLFFPNPRHFSISRPQFPVDCWLNCGFLLVLNATLWAVAHLTDQSVGLLLALGFFVPFLLWNWLIGFVIYVHHTHEGAHWYSDKRQWAQRSAYLTETAHVRFSRVFDRLLHNIFAHTAHHIDTSLSMFDLPGAQRLIEESMGPHIPILTFRWRWYFRTARTCKLYDCANHRWRPFT